MPLDESFSDVSGVSSNSFSDRRIYEVKSFDDLKSRDVFEGFWNIYSRIPANERLSFDVLKDRVENLSGLLKNDRYHLIVLEENGHILGYSAGRWLSNIDTGFVAFLGTDASKENKGIGTLVRDKLIETYQKDSMAFGRSLNAVVGEIDYGNTPYLTRLAKRNDISFLDLTYTQGAYDDMESGILFNLYLQVLDDAKMYNAQKMFKSVDVVLPDKTLMKRYAVSKDYSTDLIKTLYEKIYKTTSSPELAVALDSIKKYDDYVFPRFPLMKHQ